MWNLSCRTKSRKKRPKFAAVDLFPRACIENRFSMAVFTNFAATLARQTAAASLASRSKNYLK